MSRKLRIKKQPRALSGKLEIAPGLRVDRRLAEWLRGAPEKELAQFMCQADQYTQLLELPFLYEMSEIKDRSLSGEEMLKRFRAGEFGKEDVIQKPSSDPKHKEKMEVLALFMLATWKGMEAGVLTGLEITEEFLQRYPGDEKGEG